MDKKPSKITLIPQKIVKETNFNSFCSGFFISSFPYKNGKVIAGSKNLMSLCNHIRCSKLEAMEPEIIYKYPLEDTKKLEINNLNASICFPNGIKVCYNQEKENIKIINNFSTKITNQFGERYYMVMFFFYREIDSLNYSKLYTNQPIKNYLKKFGENIFHTEKKKKKKN